ncbi:hypothetical protein BK703_16785 [Bacillus thuringiensis serovar silo]|uniref:hypothetical protein n=1 Tax=Bacillus thuringiensis TaxID=1428 RepID=UPI000A3C6429|nr:hypothetical protein [Bacillus thuringiensis]MED3275416.1 hypothetical protein [Bacillus thuringiensis]OTW55294.1 hypothetical protein BK703_16785 [Bacillus thuringiensis serovar silo]OTW74274.1 hypothetical protein BK700_01260 [Bacillus thuringiensis serovar toguchini]
MNPKEVTRAFNALQQGIIARGSGKSAFPNFDGLMELAMAGAMSEEELEQHRHDMKMKSRRFIARKCGKRGRY